MLDACKEKRGSPGVGRVETRCCSEVHRTTSRTSMTLTNAAKEFLDECDDV